MKILLVIPRYGFTNKINYEYAFPLGLAYISSILKDNGHEVICFNLNHYNGKMEDLINEQLDRTNFDIVCTGHMAVGYIIIEKIVNTVREHKSRPAVILGGPIITAEPEFMVKLLKPDFAVVGEGEVTLLELLEAIQKKSDFDDIEGICYINKEGKVILTEPRPPINDLDSLPLPDFEGFEYNKFLNNISSNYIVCAQLDYPRIYPILCSRGCPYQCTFCYHSLGTKYRQRSVDSVMMELHKNVRRYKINIISIYDDLFSIDKQRLYDFCKRLNDLRKELPWELKWSCQLFVNTVDREMLKKLKDSGCCWVSYGFESMSQKVLRSMNKPTTPQKIVRAFQFTREARLAVQANFIFGDVAETMETANDTLRSLRDIFNGQVASGFIQPYPGSEIYKHCIRKGIIKDKLNFIKYGMSTGKLLYYNMTEGMSSKEFKKLKQKIFEAVIKYSRFVHPISFKKMDENRYQIEIQCPFCHEKMLYKNFKILNKLTFVDFIGCRRCGARFYVAGRFKFIANKVYPLLKPLFDFYMDKKDVINKNLL